MFNFLKRIFQFFWEPPKGIYVHPKDIPDSGLLGFNIGFSKTLASFRLDAGQWVILAKASTRGYGGNSGPTDCRLKIFAKEGEREESDESYESPIPMLASTVMVMLPFKVEKLAQFRLEAAVQGDPAEFLHIKLTATRDLNTI